MEVNVSENVGFIGEKIVHRIVRDLVLKALSPDACNDIGNQIGQSIGPALYKAVERMIQFQETNMDYSNVPNVLAEQLLMESNNGNVMAGPAVGGWLSNITDLISKLKGTGLDLNAIIVLVKQAIPLIKSGDWMGVISLLLEQFATKAAPTGPTIVGGQ